MLLNPTIQSPHLPVSEPQTLYAVAQIKVIDGKNHRGMCEGQTRLTSLDRICPAANSVTLLMVVWQMVVIASRVKKA